MRKQELIHLHGLLAEVSTYLERQGEGTLETPRYDEVVTSPTSIHQGKGAHKEAVFCLLSDLVENTPESDDKPRPRETAD